MITQFKKCWQYCLSHVDIFLLLLLGVIALIYFQNTPTLPQFAVMGLAPASTLVNKNKHGNHTQYNYKNINIIFESELIPQPSFLKSAHSASLEVLGNGDLIALWFAGSHEGKPDVQIWQSIYHSESMVHEDDVGAWSNAIPMVSPASLSEAMRRLVIKVGNPVVYRAMNGQLHLFVVSVTIGGWSGSHLNHLVSNNNGKTWGRAERLILSPLFNLSTLDRTTPVTLADGGFYLPVYHECIYTYPELLQFDPGGHFVQQIRMNDMRYLLQPSVVTLSESSAQAFMRNKARINNVLYTQFTYDGGLNWSEPTTTNLSNQDSSIVVVTVGPQQLLMLHNGTTRSTLALAVSSDGIQWHDIYDLENESGSEFSYPAIKVHNNIVDILYTWKRLQIKHVRFNLKWLRSISSRVAKTREGHD